MSVPVLEIWTESFDGILLGLKPERFSLVGWENLHTSIFVMFIYTSILSSIFYLKNLTQDTNE